MIVKEASVLSTPEKILFVLLAAISLYFSYLGFKRVRDVIVRGEKGFYPRYNLLTRRVADALRRTITQVTVFRDRPVASFFHSFIFYGFIFYAVVNVVDFLEGFVPPTITHSLNFGVAGSFYRLGGDLFSALVIIGVVFFLWRRFVTRPKRLAFGNERTLLHEGVTAGRVTGDSLIVGFFILGHVGFRMLAMAALIAYEGVLDPWQPVASALSLLIPNAPGALAVWHIGWWGALGLILLFLPYFPRSKHIHLFMAPVNFALERRDEAGRKVPLGALEPIDFEDEAAEQFGVARLEHYREPQLLDAYACIMCNRCTNVCPAHATGKALSPSAIEINKRLEINEIAPAFAGGEPSPRGVMDFVLNEESLWACTTCGACIEICPVGCEQMIDIVDIRRDRVMMEGEFPAELNTAFRGMERAGNPWGLSQDKRGDWTEGLQVPTTQDNPDFEVLYWVGCAGAYDPKAQGIARAMVEILERAGVNYAILGKREKCTGDPARRAGNEYLYHGLASENVEVLNDALIDERLDASKPKRVVATCPHCFNALKNDYPQLGGDYKVVHHTQLLDELMSQGKLPPMDLSGDVTYHDPCYLGRHNGEYEAPREVLKGSGLNLTELPRNKNNSFCCGAGGAQFWKEEEPGRERVSENRMREIVETGAPVVAAACPFCKVMLSSSDSAGAEGAPQVLDIVEIVAGRMSAIEKKLGAAPAD
jgi:Fe-S oxidoreductase